jgi:hypothetical protein
LLGYGIVIWFYQDHLLGDLKTSINVGLKNSIIILFFLTQRYRDKINKKTKRQTLDYRELGIHEFSIIQENSVPKEHVIPAILDPKMRYYMEGPSKDTGEFATFFLGNPNFIDFSSLFFDEQTIKGNKNKGRSSSMEGDMGSGPPMSPGGDDLLNGGTPAIGSLGGDFSASFNNDPLLTATEAVALAFSTSTVMQSLNNSPVKGAGGVAGGNYRSPSALDSPEVRFKGKCYQLNQMIRNILYLK